MNICILGDGITGLTLAKGLIDKNIKVFLFGQKNNKYNDLSTRTVGISKNNFDFFNTKILKLRKSFFWKIDQISIFDENNKKEKIIEFKKTNRELFYIIKNDNISNLLEKKLKKSPLFKKKIIKNNFFYKKILKEKKFDLIINCEKNNIISENILNKKLYKDYKSSAFTTLIKHRKEKNNIATQIFLKDGPIAFLPISNVETSVVYSKINSKDQFNISKLENIIKNYNLNYKISSISNIKRFPLSMSIAKKYFEKNILAFGDNLHQIHPLAGQGFNMTLRDTRILMDIIDENLSLGLPIDYSIFKNFEKKTKHLNFAFSKGIDIIYEIFKINNKNKINFSSDVFKIVGRNKYLNSFFINYADKGINI